MSDLFEARQYIEAASDDEGASARAEVESAVLDVHTSGPGIIVSFNKDEQTAVVQPAIHKFFRGQGFKPMPKLMDVPVQFPRGGGFVLTFPVEPGDECLITFAERSIDNWHQNGGTQPPSDYRTHSLSDAFATVGVSSIPKAVKDFNADAVELRSLDGKAKVQIGKDKAISVSSETGDITVSSSVGMVKLNAPPGATALTNGVLNASHPCPILGALHGVLGPPCARVLAGNT
jgi:hypothetical protein